MIFKIKLKGYILVEADTPEEAIEKAEEEDYIEKCEERGLANMNEYKPKPDERCIICGEYVYSGEELVGGKVKRGGTRCAHKACWEAEQAENAKEV